MLTFSGLTKTFGGRTLFSDASLALMAGDRVGLVGPNGAGKTTLFRILLGQETADEGTVAFARGSRVGILPQESAPAAEESILDIALGHVAPVAGEDPAAMEIHDSAISTDGETVARAKRILSGLGFRERDYDRKARELSGGWVMRAHLARLLVWEPDLLMLDEPTNHLDLDALLWIQNYLRSYPGALLLISHDREFLNQLCTHIVEVRQARLFKYTGNYDRFLEQREATDQQLVAAAKAQQRRIDQLQEFADRFRAKNTKASQAQSKLKQIARLREEQVELIGSDAVMGDFKFPQPTRSGLRAIRMTGVQFGYDDRSLVYEHLDFEAEREKRIVLVGPNGAGKSTLLKLLAGVLTPRRGEVTLGHNVRSGYYAQYRLDTLNPARTVLEEAFDTPQRVTETFVRTVLGSFLFRGDDVFKRVSVLSGGEKSRLALVKLLLDPPNLLLMDEPTTHLDLASVDALIEALRQYEGTLVFISHDVHFIRSIANHVVHVRNGKLTHYPGDYGYYLDKTRQAERAGLTSTGVPAPAAAPAAKPVVQGRTVPDVARREQKRAEAESRQNQARERRDLQRQVRALEAEITGMEAREKELVHELEQPATYNTPGRALAINRELLAIQDLLPTRQTEWERASEQLLALEAR